jgi:hypothetical protein
LRIPLIAGASLAQDSSSPARVVINQAFAERYWKASADRQNHYNEGHADGDHRPAANAKYSNCGEMEPRLGP